MVNNEEALTIGAGAAGGLGVPFLVRVISMWTRPEPPSVHPARWIRDSIRHDRYGTGIAGVAAGMFGDKLGLRDERMKTAAFAYGVTALASGIISGYEPSRPCLLLQPAGSSGRLLPDAGPCAPAAAPAAAAAITYRRPRTY